MVQGLGKVRSDRLLGWIPIRDLDIKGQASVIRMLEDAQRGEGLMRQVVTQLHSQWEEERGAAKRRTWWGHMLCMVRRTWPGFSVEMSPSIRFLGVLERGAAGYELHRRFQKDAWAERWRARQRSIITARPGLYQHDFVIFNLLKGEGLRDSSLMGVLPAADTGAVQTLIRMLAGLEDFARTNAHFTRRKYFPGLSESSYERCCLHCFLSGIRVIDSEWHALFDCPLVTSARGRFTLCTEFEFAHSKPSNPEDLVSLLSFVRNSPRSLGHLATFAYDIRATRHHNFRRLCSNGRLGRGRVLMRLVWERWKDALSVHPE